MTATREIIFIKKLIKQCYSPVRVYPMSEITLLSPSYESKAKFTTFTFSESVGNGTEVLMQKLLRFFVF